MGEINVVPYIDVMLVLLIIFMVTAPLLTQGIEVDLPKADAEPLDVEQENEPLVLSVDREGRLYLNVGESEEPVDAQTAAARTAAVLRRAPQTPVLVRADESVSHGVVVRAMALLQGSGAQKIGIMTDPAEFPKEAEER
ncbi:MAG: protein TolR [Gammaproteobacteria bacterium]|jgi:biopolymer transport protein TolR|nr:MAG: protein TolR [Gammaproteobacteria bacterium SG8_31]